MKKKSFILTLATVIYFLFPATVRAVCPVCTVAVVGGLGLARFLGVDDTVSGIWIGGIILSTSLWFVDWIYKKLKKMEHINRIIANSVMVTITYLFVLVPLYLSKIIGHPFNTFWGVDKLILGIILGSIAFTLGMVVDKRVRKINNGKVLFQFQRVVFPVAALIISSVIMYLITR